MELAGGELGAASTSATILDRVRETLQAIAADPDTREQARAGRLVREQRVATLGGGPVVGAPSKPGRTRSPRKRAPRSTSSADAAELRRARAEIKRLRKRADAARTRERRARQALERAEAKADSARVALEQAEQGAQSARDALADAEAETARADDEVSEGEARVDELES